MENQSYNIPVTCQVKDLNNIYLKYFGYKTDGFFVDVGAFDGVQHSNTWGLACAGWQGICYEPIDSIYRQCNTNHAGHDVLVINSCVGNEIGVKDFYIAGVLSTYNDDYLNSEFWKNEYRGAIKTQVHITTLNDSLVHNKIKIVKPNFELLSIDVEGAESDVLRGFNIDYWQPQMVIIEAQELHPAKELSLQAPFINKYFEDANYEKIYCDEINNIYVRKI